MSPAGVPSQLDVHIRHKSYRAASGGRLHVLGEVSIALAHGEVAAIVGPSGCGKTTLLRIIVGLDRDFEGSVRLPAHGRLGVVFQEPRLLPWRTRRRQRPARRAASERCRAERAIRRRSASPRTAAIIPASCRSALPAGWPWRAHLRSSPNCWCSMSRSSRSTRRWPSRLRAELIELVSRRPVTTLLVTHNIEEATGLADRVFLLSASPARVLAEVPIEHPRSARTRDQLATLREEIMRKTDA